MMTTTKTWTDVSSLVMCGQLTFTLSEVNPSFYFDKDTKTCHSGIFGLNGFYAEEGSEESKAYTSDFDCFFNSKCF